MKGIALPLCEVVKKLVMKRKMLSGKDLIKLGYPEGRAVGIAINTVLKYFRRSEKEEIYTMLKAVLANPKEFIDDSIWSKTAMTLGLLKKNQECTRC
jgi:tRNA-splicing ligase RtcB (3'-phosphate/5'-hydroxy nucleic acid ligase)